MSATSNKSRLMLFLLIVISLVFFLTSFLTAAFTNDIDTVPSNDVRQESTADRNCIVVRTAQDRLLADCNFA